MICRRCKVDKPLEAFAKSNLRAYDYTCKPCARERSREWRLQNRERERERFRQYRAEKPELFSMRNHNMQNPLKKGVTLLARQALASGLLDRHSCEECGDCNAMMHHDDYGKPLNVRWLCMSCHQYYHSQVALKGGE